ncbi:MAG TPA: RNA polymerase Rpb4 family protein [Methanomicrobia archaeon]|nr:DNA-directed RNA polymerase [Candidatus Alkanophaga volatiphilum]HDO63268.1 RNA polymerase Rpb4 family protein [Methanomicrobia archaeon]HEX58861.1 RNA polymerase Rpb4 family protein [Methanomicrobia archaeon]
MIVKQVLSEELLTLAEVHEILKSIKEEHKDEEMSYEKRRVLEYSTKFSKTNAKASRELLNELLKLEKMNEFIAVKIVDLMPKSREELRSIYAKEGYTLTEEELDAILDIVAKYE